MRKVFIPALALLAITGCQSFENLVLIENNSKTVCTSVTVTVCDSTWTIQNMTPGEEREFTIVYTKDDSFHVTVQSANGKSLEGSFGYVTHGISGDRIRISIENDSIGFRQSGSGY